MPRSEGLVPGCLDAWMLAGLKGFEEVADRWEEGIGSTEDLRNSHTHKLQELGGLLNVVQGMFRATTASTTDS